MAGLAKHIQDERRRSKKASQRARALGLTSSKRRRGRPPALSKLDRAVALDAYLAGEPLSALTRRFGCSRPTLTRAIALAAEARKTVPSSAAPVHPASQHDAE